MYNDDDYILLSGIQHFAFCRRQWALIHVEGLWEENYRTADGRVMHNRAHNNAFSESRGDLLIRRGMKLSSTSMGVSGECDVVEFRLGKSGIPIADKDGLWQPYPVEYKRGEPKYSDIDELQLCAEAMCLEEMLCTDIPVGALYYGETRHRVEVHFSDEMREKVRTTFAEMHELLNRGYTPKAKPSKGCNACSLRDLCLPRLSRKKSVGEYLAAAMKEDG